MNILLFTGIEGTGRETLAYSNFIKPIKEKTISFVTIRDIMKGNICRDSFVFPILNTDTHPGRFRFVIFFIQLFFYLLILYPFIKNKRIIVRGIPVGYVLSKLGIGYRLFLPGLYSKEGKVYSLKNEEFLQALEREAINKAERVFVPNEEIKVYIESNYSYEYVKVVYIPVDTKLFKPKEKLKSFSMVYSGTIPDKETEEDILKTFYGFKKFIKDLKLFILSRKNIELEDVHSFFLNRERLRDFLPKMHFGLVMEGRNENSKFLLTTKFSEYAASGVPVIVHKGIKALVDIVLNWNLGIVVDPDNIDYSDVLKIIKNYDEYSINIREFAEKNLSYEVFRERVLNE